MTKKEAAQVLAILKAAYPNSYKGMTQEEAVGTVSVWALQFADMPVDIVLLAIHKAISSSRFPPSVAEVKEKIKSLSWEAEAIVYGSHRHAALTEKDIKRAERIYDATRKYSYTQQVEASLTDMLLTGDKLLLPDETTR